MTVSRYELSFFIGPCDPADAEKLALAILDLPEFQEVGGGGVGVARFDDDEGGLRDVGAYAGCGATCGLATVDTVPSGVHVAHADIAEPTHNEEAARMFHGWGARAASGGL